MTSNQTFYCLSPPGIGAPLYGKNEWAEKFQSAEFVEGSIDYESVECPLDQGHARAGMRIGNLQLVLPTPHFSDFVWTIMNECVVTDQVLQLFKDQRFTGFDTAKASIVKVKRRPKISAESIPRVWELLVKGRGGDASLESGIKLIYVCSGCGLRRYSSFRNGIVVDPNQWDGSDFFTANGYARFILITERVKDVIIRNRLTNCAIFRSQDLQWGDLPRPEEHPGHAPVRKAE